MKTISKKVKVIFPLLIAFVCMQSNVCNAAFNFKIKVLMNNSSGLGLGGPGIYIQRLEPMFPNEVHFSTADSTGQSSFALQTSGNPADLNSFRISIGFGSVSIEDTLTVPVDQVDQIEKTYICSDSNLWKGEIDSRIQYTGLIPIFVSYKFKENAFLGWACASPSPHLGPKCKVVWLIDGVAQDSSMETFSSLKNISRTKYFEEGGVHTICAKVINLATSESQFFCKEIDFEPWNYLYGYVNLKNYQAQVSDSFQVELFGLNREF
jgi:hypothetical protein